MKLEKLIPLSAKIFSQINNVMKPREPTSKIRFWFKIAAGPSFKPQAYGSISRIWNEAPTKILGQKTFLRWVLFSVPH